MATHTITETSNLAVEPIQAQTLLINNPPISSNMAEVREEVGLIKTETSAITILKVATTIENQISFLSIQTIVHVP